MGKQNLSKLRCRVEDATTACGCQFRGTSAARRTPFPGLLTLHHTFTGDRGAVIFCRWPRLAMLKLLRINNIALVPALELELGPGLTLLTGETGAGKSILIDALGLVLGDRASADLIRTGEEQAVGRGRLRDAERARLCSSERGLPADGDEIVLRRELQASGKGRATVNGALVPVALLRDLAPHLAVVHGQHEPQGLLDPETHLGLVDHFAGERRGAGRSRSSTASCARPRRRSRRCAATGARPSGAARCSSSRRARSRRPSSRPARRRRSARRRRARPTPGGSRA